MDISSAVHRAPPWGAPRCGDDGRLAADATCDVVVVGSGVCGLSVAHELAVRGARVIVLEAREVGRGQTMRTTAHLVTALDRRYFALEAMFGREQTRRVADGHAAAIDRMERLVEENAIACAFARVPGYLTVPDSLRSRTEEMLDRERAAAGRAGVLCERVAGAPGLHDCGPALEFPRQAQAQPMEYLDGLARLVRERGGRMHIGARVERVESEGSAVRAVTRDGHTVTAGAAVLATHVPIDDEGALSRRQAAQVSYVIGVRTPRGAMPDALVWDGYWEDQEEPYHYLRLAGDLLLVGGEDHAAGARADAGARFARLEAWVREHAPWAGEVECRWSGVILEPRDELAFIGPSPERRGVFLVSGDSGNGMTYAGIAAIMLPDLIAGRTHPWADLYDPARGAGAGAGAGAAAGATAAAENQP